MRAKPTMTTAMETAVAKKNKEKSEEGRKESGEQRPAGNSATNKCRQQKAS